jgi:hypothetical protein
LIDSCLAAPAADGDVVLFCDRDGVILAVEPKQIMDKSDTHADEATRVAARY